MLAGELPGTLIVQLLVDRKWEGGARWLCGRRGTQVTMYAVSALFGFLLGFPQQLGADWLLVCAMVSRASITAATATTSMVTTASMASTARKTSRSR